MRDFLVTWIDDFGNTYVTPVKAETVSAAKDAVWQNNKYCLSVLHIELSQAAA